MQCPLQLVQDPAGIHPASQAFGRPCETEPLCQASSHSEARVSAPQLLPRGLGSQVSESHSGRAPAIFPWLRSTTQMKANAEAPAAPWEEALHCGHLAAIVGTSCSAKLLPMVLLGLQHCSSCPGAWLQPWKQVMVLVGLQHSRSQPDAWLPLWEGPLLQPGLAQKTASQITWLCGPDLARGLHVYHPWSTVLIYTAFHLTSD